MATATVKGTWEENSRLMEAFATNLQHLTASAFIMVHIMAQMNNNLEISDRLAFLMNPTTPSATS